MLERQAGVQRNPPSNLRHFSVQVRDHATRVLSRTLAGDNRRIPGYSLLRANQILMIQLAGAVWVRGSGSNFHVGLGKGANIKNIRT